ncbi:MAG: hypothetical protein QNJ46_17285 [Leptolyngbyaceae cyanobacterium MO_188.B28]|nr:hypothetical protein [Leptolyngbyaceae cyanobacterium MO_188.B28]
MSLIIGGSTWLIANCAFDKTPTVPILLFEGLIAVGVIACFWVLPKIKDKIFQRFFIVAIAVLIFELFTAPMWHNHRMGVWAYIYRDVSWILTLGWTALILSVVVITDKLLAEWKEWKRFFVYLGVLTIAVCFLEALVVNIGIRSYSPEVLDSLSGIYVFKVPIEALYYTPVFMGLVISFYKYWCFLIDDPILIPVKRRKWLRALFITALGIFLFEVMIEPMVSNEKLPQWSFIFHDISILLTGLWIIVIGLTAILVSRFFIQFSTTQKFIVALIISTAIALPIEYWLMINGYRVYGESAIHNFSGFMIPILDVPIEIAFAIPCYLALIIAFIRYWEIVFDNRL